MARSKKPTPFNRADWEVVATGASMSLVLLLILLASWLFHGKELNANAPQQGVEHAQR